MNRNPLSLLVLAALGAALVGCGSPDAAAGPVPTKDDFAKKPKPDGYIGPGQPGGPSTGAPAGPPPGTKGAPSGAGTPTPATTGG